MKYGILFKPTNEFVSFNDEKGKAILFTDDEKLVQKSLFDLVYADGGYDGSESDFALEAVEYDTDGSEYLDNTDNKEVAFVAKSLIK